MKKFKKSSIIIIDPFPQPFFMSPYYLQKEWKKENFVELRAVATTSLLKSNERNKQIKTYELNASDLRPAKKETSTVLNLIKRAMWQIWCKLHAKWVCHFVFLCIVY